MLHDRTNVPSRLTETSSLPVQKTFTRRAKKDRSASGQLKVVPSEQQHPSEQTPADSSDLVPSPESSPDVASIDSKLASSEQYSWLNTGLRCRRTSQLFPDGVQPVLLDLASGMAKKPGRRGALKSEQQRLADLRALMEEMALYFQEVDAFELAEESPPAKPSRSSKHNPSCGAPKPPTAARGAISKELAPTAAITAQAGLRPAVHAKPAPQAPASLDKLTYDWHLTAGNTPQQAGSITGCPTAQPLSTLPSAVRQPDVHGHAITTGTSHLMAAATPAAGTALQASPALSAATGVVSTPATAVAPLHATAMATATKMSVMQPASSLGNVACAALPATAPTWSPVNPAATPPGTSGQIPMAMYNLQYRVGTDSPASSMTAGLPHAAESMGRSVMTSQMRFSPEAEQQGLRSNVAALAHSVQDQLSSQMKCGDATAVFPTGAACQQDLRWHATPAHGPPQPEQLSNNTGMGLGTAVKATSDAEAQQQHDLRWIPTPSHSLLSQRPGQAIYQGAAAATPHSHSQPQQLQQQLQQQQQEDLRWHPTPAAKHLPPAAAAAAATPATSHGRSATAVPTPAAAAAVDSMLASSHDRSSMLPTATALLAPPALSPLFDQSASVGIASSAPAATAQLPPLQRLLQICGQELDPAAIPSMEALLSSLGDLRRVAKVGEGSYGEAFKQGSTVYKIIPIEGQQLVNGYPQKKAADLTGEALVALTLSDLRKDTLPDGQACPNMAPSFVETSKVAICHGPYPRVLAKAWHQWDQQHGSENDAVDGPGFGPGCPASRLQLYLVLAMGDSGRDLEKHVLHKGMEEARAILVQAAFALAVGEAAVQFEHRDLHWGNLLIRPATSKTLGYRLEGQDLQVQTCGVQVSLIDFTASRLITSDGQLACCDLSQDPEIFEGPKGKIQFDTYRFMQALTGDSWSASCPATNCLWMAYLAETLAAEKIGGGTGAAAHKRTLREFRKRCMQYSCCKDLALQDDLFKGMWAPSTR